MEINFDVIVIGSGPGGYTAAIRAAQLGLKVAIIEKYATLGGTCTNVGCIPSKALLDSSEHYYQANHQFDKHGIQLQQLELNFEQFMKRKKEVVEKNTGGVLYLMKKNKVTVFQGKGSFENVRTIRVVHADQETVLTADYFVIATGSKPSTIPGVVIDKRRIISSTEVLSFPTLPKSMIIIGGGVIGVELASVFSRLGTQVTIIEYTDLLIPSMDKELGRALNRVLNRLQVAILLNSRVQSAVNEGAETVVTVQDNKGNRQELKADHCVVAVGRRAYTEGLNLEAVGIQLRPNGKIPVNSRLQTVVGNIYAIGDVIEGPMLAHKAEDEGTFVAENIKGLKSSLNYDLIPSVIYTWPEVASVGRTEEQLQEKGTAYNVGKFPYLASARARASMDTEGFVKVLTDPQSGEILGVHLIGPRAADLIAQAVIAMEFELTDQGLGRLSYAHPTFSEALKDAYLQASGQGAINL